MNAQDMNHGGRFHMDDRGIRYCDVFPEIENNLRLHEYFLEKCHYE